MYGFVMKLFSVLVEGFMLLVTKKTEKSRSTF